MKQVSFLFVAIILNLLISCSKKDLPKTQPKKIDTIKPLSYLPAYPGSYWKFSDNVTYTTSPGYVKDTYLIRDDPSHILTSDTVYVPLYNNLLIWGYEEHNESALNTNLTSAFIPIISEVLPLKSSWVTSSMSHQIHYTSILAKDTSIVIEGKTYFPTIALLETWSSNNGPQMPLKRTYYTKDIGLVKTETLNISGMVTSESHLVDYFINKH